MRLNVAMCVPGMAFHGDTLKHASLGGSETAALCVARELAALGNKVVVFCNCDRPGEYDGVVYTTIDRYVQYCGRLPLDVAIVERTPQIFETRLNAKINILWQHDLALGRQKPQFNGVMWNVDHIAVVSEYMKDQYVETYDTDPSMIWVARNGIDLDLFPEPRQRDPKKLMYCARPERGLDILVDHIMPNLIDVDPEITLYIAGYDNKTDAFVEFYRHCEERAQALDGNVVNLGCLSKRELYEHYATAAAYVYPTPSSILPAFREVSCISAMECMGSGLPIVTTKCGALPETMGVGTGALIDVMPDDTTYVEKFCDAVMSYIRNPSRARATGEAGRRRAQTLTWAGVAMEWQEKIEALIDERNDCGARLDRHLMRQGDRVPAGATPSSVEIAENADRLNDEFPDAFDMVPSQPRFRPLVEFFQSRPELRDVLDFGCGNGLYGLQLKRAIPDLRLTCYDPSTRARERVAEIAGRHDIEVEVVDKPRSDHDAVLVLDVVSHVVDPTSVLVDAETCVREGGIVYVSVPFGPWEHKGADDRDVASQLWDLSMQDIEDLAGHKPDFDLYGVPGRFNEFNGQAIGWHIIRYKADHSPVGDIDIARHRRLQVPQQTVSANLICGPNVEETLEWCLKSIRDYVDEIVIADCGMAAPALEIARRYNARRVPSPSPLEEGFETPRNIALEASTTDWVFWIDSDEKLLDGHNMAKYLRENHFQGYGVKQHHFAVDTVFKPDMPVRLFRRRPRDGKTMRFWGMIHEHPELGLNEGPGPVIVLTDLHIAHVGYLAESGRKKRFWRNNPLLEKDKAKYPTRMLQKHFIMRDNVILAAHLLTERGGVDAEVRRLCEETVSLYREHFLGQSGYINIDSIQYYSQANEILGQGVDVAFDVAAARDGNVPPLNGGKIRFASKDDLLSEINWRAVAAVDPLLKESW